MKRRYRIPAAGTVQEEKPAVYVADNLPFAVWIILALAGLAAGFFLYIFLLLGQPLRTDIKISNPLAFEPISLDHIDLNDESELVPWGEDGRTRVYVHPDFPILKVEQKDPQVENILVFGIDARSSSDIRSRADSLIIVTIDQKHEVIKLTSVMRDTRVDIAGRSQPDRINAAYAYGGVGLLINTINSTFDLDIQRFAMFDFWSAASLIDSVGGVKLTVSREELPYLNRHLQEQNRLVAAENRSPELEKAGKARLDGQQAIAWARIRKLDSDQMRTSRQRMVMMSLIDQYAETGIIGLISLAGSDLSAFETNMRPLDLLRVSLNGLPRAGDIFQYQVPQEGMYRVNQNPWMMIVDLEIQIPALHDFIWGDPR